MYVRYTSVAAIVACCLLSCATMSAQTAKLLDLVTLQPIEGAKILSVGPKTPTKNADTVVLWSNARGEFDASRQSVMLFYCVGYEPLELSSQLIAAANNQVFLTPSSTTLGAVTISATPFEQERDRVAQNIMRLSKRDIQFANSTTAADLLTQTGQVFVQRSQGGGGSPMIRGFEASRVLMVMDGIRLNNAIYRAGHLQNVLTVGSQFLEGTEVLFGPSSTVYGSDALGGVMHFHTLSPRIGVKTAATRIGYASANSEKTASLTWNIGGKKWAWMAGLAVADFGDMRMGSKRSDAYPDFGKRSFYVARIDGVDSMVTNPTPNVQVDSGYKQVDAISKVLWQSGANTRHTFTGYFTTTGDIPRYDRLTETSNGKPKSAQWYYGPQQLLLGSYKLDLGNSNRLYDQANVVLAFQNVLESRHNRNFNATTINHRNEEVNVLSANINFQKAVGATDVQYGIEAQYNDVTSTATKEDIVTGAVVPQSTRYASGGAQMSNMAIFAAFTRRFNDKITLNVGTRASYTTLDAKFTDKSFFPFPFDVATQRNPALNGNVGMVYAPIQKLRFAASVATGFRVPNVDDLTKVFDSAPGKVVVPNPDLGPERTLNFDLTARYNFTPGIYLEATGFFTKLQNALVLEPSTFNGASTVVYDDSLSNILQLTNARQGTIMGGNVAFVADFTKNWSFEHTITFTQGHFDDETGMVPLDHVAPTFGRTGVTYRNKGLRAELYSLYAAAKKLEDYNPDGEDNLQYATADGMPAWWTLNLNAAYQITRRVQVQASVENILDVHYRMFGSGFSAPGRNFRITLRSNF